ncbi:MAG: STAS domain-containing protein [Candidatus Dormibacteraeota bacterium]|nr:STAS domain-containing protein [Candidatus Dormibacteraeota bacterium]
MPVEHVLADNKVVISWTGSPGWLSIIGTIDYFNDAAVAAALRGELDSRADRESGTKVSAGDGGLHLDLSRLEFADAAAIRALVSVANDAKAGQQLVLHGLPSLIRKVMLMVGWGEMPGLVIDEGGTPGASP